MTARGDSLGCSRNPGSNYYAGLTHQLMIDLDADDAAKVSVFHSLWVGKAGGELLRNSLRQRPPDPEAPLQAGNRDIHCRGGNEHKDDAEVDLPDVEERAMIRNQEPYALDR